MITCVEYVLPAYFASSLINGDDSGLADGEADYLDQWLHEVKPGSCVSCGDESYFSHSNDMNSMAGDVLVFTFHVIS